MSMDQIQVWQGRVQANEALYASYWRLLDNEEQARAQRFSHQVMHQQYVEIHGRLRLLLAQILSTAPESLVIAKTAQGKPYLVNYPALAFNLSHTQDRFLIAVAWHCRVGIDIEVVKPRASLEGLVNKCFSELESQYWHRLDNADKTDLFYRHWTRKEAFVKATGAGISVGLNQCEINPEGPLAILSLPLQCGRPTDWFLQDLDLGVGYCGAIVADKPLSSVIDIQSL